MKCPMNIPSIIWNEFKIKNFCLLNSSFMKNVENKKCQWNVSFLFLFVTSKLQCGADKSFQYYFPHISIICQSILKTKKQKWRALKNEAIATGLVALNGSVYKLWPFENKVSKTRWEKVTFTFVHQQPVFSVFSFFICHFIRVVAFACISEALWNMSKNQKSIKKKPSYGVK